MVVIAVFQFNQTFTTIYSMAASVAVMLWSVSALRNGGLSRGVATYGCVSAPMLIGLMLIGHLHMDVHGMGVVVLLHGIWFGVAGAQLWREGGSPAGVTC